LTDPFVTEEFGGCQEDGVSFRNGSASSEANKSKKSLGSVPASISVAVLVALVAFEVSRNLRSDAHPSPKPSPE
jgi:hypothetical protein